VIQKGPRRLEDGVVTLREITPEDAGNLFHWRRQERLQPIFHTSGAASYEQHEAFIASYFEPANEDCWFVFEVEERPAGTFAIYRPAPGADWETGRMVLAPELRGFKGFRYARQAGALLMEFARAAGHPYMRCEVLETNRVMQGIVTSLGFREKSRGERNGKAYLELVATLD